jgi:predicted nucleic acid-binding protein
MPLLYLDSSAVVKIYIPETGGSWVRSLVEAFTPEGEWENEIAFAKIGIVEVVAAIAKRRRMRDVTAEQQKKLTANFLDDCVERFAKFDADDGVIKLAVDLTQRHPLRGYDAIHLATAITLNRTLVASKLPPLAFISADDVLCKAAKREGLLAENPNEQGEVTNG